MEYDGWGALAKLEYIDRVLREVGNDQPEVPEPGEDDLPVSAMRYTVAEHYREMDDPLPMSDPRVFDGRRPRSSSSPRSARPWL